MDQLLIRPPWISANRPTRTRPCQEHHRTALPEQTTSLAAPGNQLLIHHRCGPAPAQESHHGVTDGKIGHFSTGLKHHPGASALCGGAWPTASLGWPPHRGSTDGRHRHAHPAPACSGALYSRAGLDHQSQGPPSPAATPTLLPVDAINAGAGDGVQCRRTAAGPPRRRLAPRHPPPHRCRSTRSGWDCWPARTRHAPITAVAYRSLMSLPASPTATMGQHHQRGCPIRAEPGLQHPPGRWWPHTPSPPPRMLSQWQTGVHTELASLSLPAQTAQDWGRTR